MSFQGRYNVYECPDGHKTVTRDIDEGVTPFLLGCRASGDTTACNLMAQSQFYPEYLPPSLLQQYEQFGWEWYQPSLKWTRRQGPETLDHVQRGGLVLRRHAPTSPTEGDG